MNISYVHFDIRHIPINKPYYALIKCIHIPQYNAQYKSLLQSCTVIAKEEGLPALWKGITPRLMRIMPGQAITFMTYEAVSTQMEKFGLFD